MKYVCSPETAHDVPVRINGNGAQAHFAIQLHFGRGVLIKQLIGAHDMQPRIQVVNAQDAKNSVQNLCGQIQ